MIELTPRAQRQVRTLITHYADVERPEAVRNLIAAVIEAGRRIERDPAAGLPAPRPYLALARTGQAWVKAGPYWVRYSTATPPVITAVFHERADIPGRADQA